MASILSLQPNLVLSPFPHRTATQNPLFSRPQLAPNKPILRGSLSVVKLGFQPDPEFADSIVDLFSRAESLLYTIADAAVSSSSPETVTTTTKQNSDWLSGIANVMESVLKVLKDGLSTLHVPYSYGFAIILLTVLVKAATFPLTKKQVESANAMRSLTPQIKAIQKRYAGDQEKIQLETARLYKLAGINPLAGCLPTLATIPVWIGLYRALSNVADEGLLSEGFFWIPSLAGPTTVVARQNGSGISWLFPFVDGHPPLGWSATFAYLVLPVLLVVSQYISVQIMQSSQPQSDDPNMKTSQAITKFLPLMIGYFALSVPSGLSLYWFTNNILSTAQQVWLQKLGNAKNSLKQFNDIVMDKPVDVKKPVSELKSSVSELKSTKEARQAEKLTAEGLRPGDRFKQIKEQEARRKQQREEEKRKAAEARGESHATNETHQSDLDALERKNGAGTGTNSVDNQNRKQQTFNGQNTSNVGGVNGGPSGQELKEDQNSISVFRIDDTEASDNPNGTGTDQQKSLEKLEKEAVEVGSSPDNKLAEEERGQAGRE